MHSETSKALSRFTALRIEFLHSLPTGDVRILLNDVPFKSARFISPYVLEAFIPAEIIADDWTYSSSYVEVIVDDDTVSWIPLRDLIKEKERRKFMDQIHETQKHFNASGKNSHYAVLPCSIHTAHYRKRLVILKPILSPPLCLAEHEKR